MRRYATMPERMAALRKVDRLISKLRRPRPMTTGYVTAVRGVEGRFRSRRGFGWAAMSRGEVSREPSSNGLAFDVIPQEPSKTEILQGDCLERILRAFLALGMTRSELRAKVERGLAEAERARRERRPRP